MRYCKKCVMPETKPGVFLDKDEICSVCRNVERKQKIDWTARGKEIESLCDKHRSKGNWDCVMPVSGGKDSYYQVHLMKEVYNMKPLCVSVKPPVQTETGRKNLENLAKAFEVDLIRVTLNPGVDSIITKRAFEKVGKIGWGYDYGIRAIPYSTAVKFGIPLIVWSENFSFESGGKGDPDSPDANQQIDDEIVQHKKPEDFAENDLKEKDLIAYKYPSKEELEKLKPKGLYLGHYHYWDSYKNYEFAKSRGFEELQNNSPGNFVGYDNIDDGFGELDSYMKYLKYGYGHATDVACRLIREKHMEREKAVELVNANQSEFPQKQMEDFIAYTRMDEKQFWEIAERFRNRKIWEKTGNEWKPKYKLV